MRRPWRLLLAGLPAVAATLALGAGTAAAGTYSVTADTTRDIAGWELNPDGGVYGCSLVQATHGPCNAADVPRPSPLRIFMYGPVAKDSYGSWHWETPAGVTILSGSIHLSYRTTANTKVQLRAALHNEDISKQPVLRTATTDGSATWPIPAGKERFTVQLRSEDPVSYVDKWQNTVAIDSMSLTLRDDDAPVVRLAGELAAGRWESSSQPVCVSVSATDGGSGVASARLLDDRGVEVAAASASAGTALHPGAVSFSRDLCVSPAAYSDGEHAMTAVVRDVAGEATYVPFTVKVDHTAPAASALVPADRTQDRRAPVSFSVDPGPSGLASLTATVDGEPMAVAGTMAAYTPLADLSYGQHMVTWHAVDNAGNARDGFWTFRVVDASPPAISSAVPGAGTSGELRRPAIGFVLTDVGTGIEEQTLRVLLDGIDVAPAGAFDGTSFAYTPTADLAFGDHQLRVLVADRSGNPLAPTAWTFHVADVTAPALGDPRPDAGSSSSDRTPVISVAAFDGGTGVDPATLSVVVDGRDVTSLGAFADGRFTYQPRDLLALGDHTVVARVSDRAGNRSAPLEWHFGVRDEAPPTIDGRLPASGSTVPGAATIGFDVTDAGSGVDPATLVVTVDGSNVATWGAFDGSRFRYAPGNLGAGVHTVAVVVADRSGNVVGPLMWQFAVANPATLHLDVASGPSQLVFGASGTIVLHATGGGLPLAGTRVLVSARPAGSGSFGPSRVLVTGADGAIRWPVSPGRTTTFRAELADQSFVAVERTVGVHRRVTAAADHTAARRGLPVRLTGTVGPSAPGSRVTVQLLTARGWTAVASPALTGRSGYSATVVPRLPGRYLLRVVAPATAVNLGGVSRTVVVVVR
jgi:hypothetical protein